MTHIILLLPRPTELCTIFKQRISFTIQIHLMMKIEGNLSITDIISRHFAGMFIAIISGFLGYYVASIFYVLLPIAPALILTAILGWSPLFTVFDINHAVRT